MKMIKNFLLILISSFIALFLAELILASFYPQARNGSWRIQNEDGVYLNKNTGKSRHEFLGKKEKISINYKFGKYHNRIIHDDKYTKGTYKEFIGIGIAVQCSSTLITCILTSRFSKLGINISGPDIIAALFTVNWAQQISDGIIKGEYAPNQAMPTLLMLIWVSTFGMGLVWYICGHLNVTEVIGIFPVPVQYGFLACIAWKVLKYGFKISMGYDKFDDPLKIGLVVLAFALGTALYFFKKWNHHLAVRILVFFMFVPIIGFLIVVLASGGNFNKDSVLREQYILFDYYEELAPWSLYVESYGNLTTGNIAWKALGDITILISMFSMFDIVF